MRAYDKTYHIEGKIESTTWQKNSKSLKILNVFFACTFKILVKNAIFKNVSYFGRGNSPPPLDSSLIIPETSSELIKEAINLRHPNSSLPSLQSKIPSHLYVSCIHCRRSAHLNWVAVHVIGGHPSSSWLSKQSLSPSQTHVCGIQWPDRGQVNWKTNTSEYTTILSTCKTQRPLRYSNAGLAHCLPGSRRMSFRYRNLLRPNHLRSRFQSHTSTSKEYIVDSRTKIGMKSR